MYFGTNLDYKTKNHEISHFYNRYWAKTKKKCLKISGNLYYNSLIKGLFGGNGPNFDRS